MPDHADFMAEIIAHPEDDGPRLVYADWLDERGDPRGEFIRLQIRKGLLQHPKGGQHASMNWDNCPRCAEVKDIERRERSMLDAYRWEWFLLLKRKPGFGESRDLRWWPVASNEKERRERGENVPILSEAIEADVRRGFIEAVTLSAADWLAHGDALVQATPIREVTLTTWPALQFNNLGTIPEGCNCRYRLADGRTHSEGDDWHYGRMGDLDPGTRAYEISVLPLFVGRWHGILFHLPEFTT